MSKKEEFIVLEAGIYEIKGTIKLPTIVKIYTIDPKKVVDKK